MGARTDFVKAMLLGVIVGIAITTAFFQLLRSPTCPPVPPASKPLPAMPVDANTQ
jgi:hypothetical protein